jgi:hypothetical protein
LRLADQGLPIFIVGSVPNITVGRRGQDEVSSNMANLANHHKVKLVAAKDFGPGLLASADITPRATLLSTEVGNATQLYTVWRHDNTSDLDAIYILNRGPMAAFNMSFAVPSDSIPWVLDAWTGKQTPLGVFQRHETGISTRITLKQKQSMILAFTKSGGKGMIVHASSHSTNVRSIRFNDAGILEAVVDGNAEATVLLSDGKVVKVPRPIRPSLNLTLGPWNLTVESYIPPTLNSSVRGTITTTPVIQLAELSPWTSIPSLKNISGVGTYITTFQLSISSSPLSSPAVLLHLGQVLNTIRAWVNSRQVSVIDSSDPVVDISDLVVPGENTVRIEVTSTLFNAVKARLTSLRSVGMSPNKQEYYTKVNYTAYGLIGPVVVEVLDRAVISL